MKNSKIKKTKPKLNKFIYYTPRILSILFILFLSLFSFDVFDSCNSVFLCILALLIHNIPSFILLIILIISWKHELVGAIAFAIAGLLYIILVLLNSNFEPFMLIWILQISGIAFIISYLFYLNYKKKKSIS